VCFGDYGGFPLKTKKQSIPLAYTSEDAKPSKALVLTYIPHKKGKVVIFSSSYALKDKYLQMFDNKQLFENIFNFLSSEKIQDTEQDQKIKVTEKKVSKQKKEISTEKPPEEKPSTEKVTKPKKKKKPVTPIIKEETVKKVPEKSIEKKIDELDEKLALGDIDEVTYELEIAKVEENSDKLKELYDSKKIDLKTYISALKTIKSKEKHTCSQCGWELIGLEIFCPNCGVKIS
jgi:rubrerythrin